MNECRIIVKKHPNGKMAEEYTINSDGEKHGNCRRWSETGDLVCIESYKNGFISGDCHYYRDKQLYAILSYENGIRSGKYQQFMDGKLNFSVEFDSGMRDGLLMKLHKNGDPFFEEDYSEGKLIQKKWF